MKQIIFSNGDNQQIHWFIWFRLVWFYDISTIVDYLMWNPFSYIKTVLLETIRFSVSTLKMLKAVLFQAIPFSISTHFSPIWPIDRTQSSATILGQSWTGSDGNEGVVHIH